MFLHRHQLNGIVSSAVNPREGVVGELLVRPYSWRLLCHSNVSLVNKRCAFWNLKVGKLPLVGSVGFPNLSAKELCFRVLNYPPAE